ncbi:hypothetical protein ECG_05422 [Echinococcus granulosus]|nr:hypothetical protein ECG_05422 [Echinococcus granulosus]
MHRQHRSPSRFFVQQILCKISNLGEAAQVIEEREIQQSELWRSKSKRPDSRSRMHAVPSSLPLQPASPPVRVTANAAVTATRVTPQVSVFKVDPALFVPAADAGALPLPFFEKRKYLLVESIM